MRHILIKPTKKWEIYGVAAGYSQVRKCSTCGLPGQSFGVSCDLVGRNTLKSLFKLRSLCDYSIAHKIFHEYNLKKNNY